jgi:Glycosyl transferase family 11
MFQYGASKLLAERLGCPLIVVGKTRGKEPGLIKHWLRRRKAADAEWSELGILRRAFGRGPGIVLGRMGEVAMPALRRILFPRTFSPRMCRIVDGVDAEVFDDSFFGLVPGVWLEGYFQSERYFGENADRIHRIFLPSTEHSREMSAAIGTWPAAPAGMAAVHIRRGDYLTPREALCGGPYGLQLPANYYHQALERIPSHAPVAVFSDEPDWASRLFPDRTVWISRAQHPVIDMLLMAQCRWVVTANSSFSWWGAWLNNRPDRVVFAPLHHIGWRIGKWFPGGIDVRGWNYIQARPEAAQRADG